MANDSLASARDAKNDEFYTQYSDIESEMNAYVEYNPDVFRGKTILLPCDDPEWSNFTKYFAANFERFGIKKLISTSYAKGAGNRQITMFEMDSPLFNEEMHDTHGKLFTVTRDADGSGNIDTDDIEFSGYLQGSGDFRSEEVCRLRDEADIIITNPPFSLFREFLAWIVDAKKQFIILGNMNAITYKEVFPLLKNNEIWLGYKSLNNDMYFNVTDDYKQYLLENKKEGSAYKIIGGVVMGRLASACWFTNLDHGKRHVELPLDTMAHNLKYNKKLRKKFIDDFGVAEYPKYDNYDAIEVPFTECIPSDYVPCWFDCPHADSCRYAKTEGKEDDALCESACNGEIGVPITYLDKHSPEQFEIIGNGGSYKGEGSIADKLFVPCSHDVNVERERERERERDERTAPQGIQANHHSQDAVSATESWESRLPSSTDTVRVSSESLALRTAQDGLANLSAIPSSTGARFTIDCLLKKCNGIMGVPITFMDKFNSAQFIIFGLDRYTVPQQSLVGGRVAINGVPCYARILIQKKKGNE